MSYVNNGNWLGVAYCYQSDVTGNYRALPFDSEKRGILFDNSDTGIGDQDPGALDMFIQCNIYSFSSIHYLLHTPLRGPKFSHVRDLCSGNEKLRNNTLALTLSEYL